MAEVSVTTNGAGSEPVTVTDTSTNEVDAAWLTSSFATLNSELAQIAVTLRDIATAQVTLMEAVKEADAKLPTNLTQLLEQQQSTITNLVREQQETTRSLITSLTPVTTNTSTQPAQQEAPLTEHLPGENVAEEATQEPVAERSAETKAKRRRI